VFTCSSNASGRVKRTLDRLSRAKNRAEQLSLTDPLTGLPKSARARRNVSRAAGQEAGALADAVETTVESPR
jgi:hypothetical protein